MKKFVLVKLLMIFCVNAYSLSDTSDFYNDFFIKHHQNYLEWLDTIKNITVQTSECNHAQENPIATSSYEEHFNSISCAEGEERLPPVQFSAKLSKSDENLSSITFFTKGHIKGVVAQKSYGESAYNDLIVLEKLTKNGEVTGYNVTLSLCSFGYLLPKGSILESHQFKGDVWLDTESKCSKSIPIISANVSNSIQGSPHTLETRFKTATTLWTYDCPPIE